MVGFVASGVGSGPESGIGRGLGVVGVDGCVGDVVDAPAGVDGHVAPATSWMDVASMFGRF